MTYLREELLVPAGELLTEHFSKCNGPVTPISIHPLVLLCTKCGAELRSEKIKEIENG